MSLLQLISNHIFHNNIKFIRNNFTTINKKTKQIHFQHIFFHQQKKQIFLNIYYHFLKPPKCPSPVNIKFITKKNHPTNFEPFQFRKNIFNNQKQKKIIISPPPKISNFFFKIFTFFFCIFDVLFSSISIYTTFLLNKKIF
jgi:hypothetical protein